MNLKTWALALTATCAAASFLMKKKAPPDRLTASNLPDPTQKTLGEQGMEPGTGSDSPNRAERLQAGNAVGIPAAASSSVGGTGQSDNLFSSSSQNSPEPVAPGLPDFVRGA
jgi:hypothetical protein